MRDGVETGVYTLEEAKLQLSLGELMPHDYVLHEGLAEWTPVSQVAVLADRWGVSNTMMLPDSISGAAAKAAKDPSAGGFFLQQRATVTGPFSEEEIRGFVRDGLIQRTDKIRLPNTQDWVSIGNTSYYSNRAASSVSTPRPGLRKTPVKSGPPAWLIPTVIAVVVIALGAVSYFLLK